MKKSLPFLALAAAALTLVAGCSKHDSTGSTTDANGKKKLTLGFSQIGAESAWRTANTQSIKDSAAQDGINLIFSDAQQKQENQIKALRSFVAQGVDVIAFSPVVETGWEPVLQEIKQANIPVVLSDRAVDVSDPSLFATFIGSDFIEEGKKAGNWLADKTGGNATIVELSGTPGAAPALNRAKGFLDAISTHPGMHIVKSQSGDFTRTKGKEVMESFLRAPDAKSITALFAHNDDMALGAIQAIEEAGLQPGKDIVIVSIDGVKDALEAIKAGKLNCSVECNPLIGGQLMDLTKKLANHEEIPRRIYSQEGTFDSTNVAAALPSRKY